MTEQLQISENNLFVYQSEIDELLVKFEEFKDRQNYDPQKHTSFSIKNTLKFITAAEEEIIEKWVSLKAKLQLSTQTFDSSALEESDKEKLLSKLQRNINEFEKLQRAAIDATAIIFTQIFRNPNAQISIDEVVRCTKIALGSDNINFKLNVMSWLLKYNNELFNASARNLFKSIIPLGNVEAEQLVAEKPEAFSNLIFGKCSKGSIVYSSVLEEQPARNYACYLAAINSAQQPKLSTTQILSYLVHIDWKDKKFIVPETTKLQFNLKQILALIDRKNEEFGKLVSQSDYLSKQCFGLLRMDENNTTNFVDVAFFLVQFGAGSYKQKALELLNADHFKNLKERKKDKFLQELSHSEAFCKRVYECAEQKSEHLYDDIALKGCGKYKQLACYICASQGKKHRDVEVRSPITLGIKQVGSPKKQANKHKREYLKRISHLEILAEVPEKYRLSQQTLVELSDEVVTLEFAVADIAARPVDDTTIRNLQQISSLQKATSETLIQQVEFLNSFIAYSLGEHSNIKIEPELIRNSGHLLAKFASLSQEKFVELIKKVIQENLNTFAALLDNSSINNKIGSLTTNQLFSLIALIAQLGDSNKQQNPTEKLCHRYVVSVCSQGASLPQIFASLMVLTEEPEFSQIERVAANINSAIKHFLSTASENYATEILRIPAEEMQSKYWIVHHFNADIATLQDLVSKANSDALSDFILEECQDIDYMFNLMSCVFNTISQDKVDLATRARMLTAYLAKKPSDELSRETIMQLGASNLAAIFNWQIAHNQQVNWSIVAIMLQEKEFIGVLDKVIPHLMSALKSSLKIKKIIRDTEALSLNVENKKPPQTLDGLTRAVKKEAKLYTFRLKRARQLIQEKEPEFLQKHSNINQVLSNVQENNVYERLELVQFVIQELKKEPTLTFVSTYLAPFEQSEAENTAKALHEYLHEIQELLQIIQTICRSIAALKSKDKRLAEAVSALNNTLLIRATKDPSFMDFHKLKSNPVCYYPQKNVSIAHATNIGNLDSFRMKLGELKDILQHVFDNIPAGEQLKYNLLFNFGTINAVLSTPTLALNLLKNRNFKEHISKNISIDALFEHANTTPSKELRFILVSLKRNQLLNKTVEKLCNGETVAPKLLSCFLNKNDIFNLLNALSAREQQGAPEKFINQLSSRQLVRILQLNLGTFASIFFDMLCKYSSGLLKDSLVSQVYLKILEAKVVEKTAADNDSAYYVESTKRKAFLAALIKYPNTFAYLPVSSLMMIETEIQEFFNLANNHGKAAQIISVLIGMLPRIEAISEQQYVLKLVALQCNEQHKLTVIDYIRANLTERSMLIISDLAQTALWQVPLSSEEIAIWIKKANYIEPKSTLTSFLEDKTFKVNKNALANYLFATNSVDYLSRNFRKILKYLNQDQLLELALRLSRSKVNDTVIVSVIDILDLRNKIVKDNKFEELFDGLSDNCKIILCNKAQENPVPIVTNPDCLYIEAELSTVEASPVKAAIKNDTLKLNKEFAWIILNEKLEVLDREIIFKFMEQIDINYVNDMFSQFAKFEGRFASSNMRYVREYFCESIRKPTNLESDEKFYSEITKRMADAELVKYLKLLLRNDKQFSEHLINLMATLPIEEIVGIIKELPGLAAQAELSAKVLNSKQRRFSEQDKQKIIELLSVPYLIKQLRLAAKQADCEEIKKLINEKLNVELNKINIWEAIVDPEFDFEDIKFIFDLSEFRDRIVDEVFDIKNLLRSERAALFVENIQTLIAEKKLDLKYIIELVHGLRVPHNQNAGASGISSAFPHEKNYPYQIAFRELVIDGLVLAWDSLTSSKPEMVGEIKELVVTHLFEEDYFVQSLTAEQIIDLVESLASSVDGEPNYKEDFYKTLSGRSTKSIAHVVNAVLSNEELAMSDFVKYLTKYPSMVIQANEKALKNVFQYDSLIAEDIVTQIALNANIQSHEVRNAENKLIKCLFASPRCISKVNLEQALGLVHIHIHNAMNMDTVVQEMLAIQKKANIGTVKNVTRSKLSVPTYKSIIGTAIKQQTVAKARARQSAFIKELCEAVLIEGTENKLHIINEDIKNWLMQAPHKTLSDAINSLPRQEDRDKLLLIVKICMDSYKDMYSARQVMAFDFVRFSNFINKKLSRKSNSMPTGDDRLSTSYHQACKGLEVNSGGSEKRINPHAHSYGSFEELAFASKPEDFRFKHRAGSSKNISSSQRANTVSEKVASSESAKVAIDDSRISSRSGLRHF